MNKIKTPENLFITAFILVLFSLFPVFTVFPVWAIITGPEYVNEDETASFKTTLVPDTAMVMHVKYTWTFTGINTETKNTMLPSCKYKWSVPTDPEHTTVTVKLKYTRYKMVETPAGPMPTPILPPVEVCDIMTKKVIVKDITAPGEDETTGITGMPQGLTIKCGRAADQDIVLNIKDNNPNTMPGKWKVELFYQAGAWDFYNSGQDHLGNNILTYYLGPYPCNYAYSDLSGDPSLYYATHPVDPSDPFYSENDPAPDPQAPVIVHSLDSPAFPVDSHPLPKDGGEAWVGPIPFIFDSVTASDQVSKTLQWRLNGSRIIAPVRHGKGASYYHDLKMFVKITDSSNNCVTEGFDDADNISFGKCTSLITVEDDCPPWVAVEIINHSLTDLQGFDTETGQEIDLVRDIFSLYAKTRERFCNYDDHWDASDNYLDFPDSADSRNSFLIEYDKNMIAEDTRLIFHPIASDNLDPAPLTDLISLKSTGNASGTDPARALFRIRDANTDRIIKEVTGQTDVPIPVIFREPGTYEIFWQAADPRGNTRSMTLKMVIHDTMINVDTVKKSAE
jgi:hypothetical protein